MCCFYYKISYKNNRFSKELFIPVKNINSACVFRYSFFIFYFPPNTTLNSFLSVLTLSSCLLPQPC